MARKPKPKREVPTYLYVSINGDKLKRGEPCLWFKIDLKDHWLTPEEVEALVVEHGELMAFRLAMGDVKFLRR